MRMPFIKSGLKYLALPLILLSGSSFAADCNTQQLDQLFSLMAQRNGLMESVAAYKFINKSASYDAKQELAVLQKSQTIANKNQLDQASLMNFVQIQMDLSKQIEEYWLNYWLQAASAAPNPATTPNLNLLRQQIAAIDAKLYPQIAANSMNLKQCSLEIIRKEYTNAMTPIKGIPANPDYNQIVINALRNIVK